MGEWGIVEGALGENATGSLMVNTVRKFSCGEEAELHQNYLGAGRICLGSCGDSQKVCWAILEAVVMSSLMLICAVAASLAFGVLVAYGVCQVMFRMFRVHATAVARERSTAPSVQVAIEG